MLSYVTFALNLPIPYIAAAEDFMNMGPATQLLRGAGAFFLKVRSSFLLFPPLLLFAHLFLFTDLS